MHRRYLRLKACPRCKGDILVDKIMEGAEICIQCGYRKFIIDEPKQSQSIAKTKELKIKRRSRSKRKVA